MKTVTFIVGCSTMSIEMPKAEDHVQEIKGMGYTNFEITHIYYD